MKQVKANQHPWITIVVGLIVLVGTACYYQSILDGYVVYNGTLSIFRFYGWAVVLIGSILTSWAYFKVKALSRMWLLLSVLILNILALLYFDHSLKQLPNHFTLKLKNKTNYDLTELRFIGSKESNIDILEKGKTLVLKFNHYSEYYDIDLIFRLENGGPDTMNVAKDVTHSCGYYLEMVLNMENGCVTKH